MCFRLALLAAAFVIPLAAHAQPIPITGEVVGVDGRPLAGVEARLLPRLSAYETARLQVSGKPADPAATATTDTAGRFRLTAPRPGMWRVVVRSGTIAARFDLTPLTAPLLLPRVPLGKDFYFLLGPQSLRRGNHEAVLSWKAGAEAVSAAPPLPASGGCRRLLQVVSAERPAVGAVVLLGAVPQELSNAQGLLSVTKTVTVPAPEPLEVVLQRRLQIVLRVVDEAGKPVTSFQYSVEALAAGTLSVRRASGGSRSGFRTGETTVNLDGPGRYRVSVQAEGLVPVSVFVEVGPEGLDAPLTFVLSAGGTVVGRVTDSEGAPLPEAEVTVVSDRWSPPAKSDGTGSFRLAGVALGSRTLSASRQGYQEQAQSLEVRPGENRVDFQLVPGVTVAGRVVTVEDGAPVAGAAVRLDWNWGAPPIETVSAADGSFTLAGVAPGVYQVSAAKPGFAQGDGVPLSVGSAPVQNLEVRLEVGGTVRGQVTGLDYKALAQVQISVLPTVSADTQPARPDFQGAFRLDHLPAGSWTIVAEAGSRIIQRQVEVTSGRETHVELAFKSGFRLSGRVTQRGEPVAGVNVRASGLDNDSLGQMTTDADGAFVLPDLAAGRHLLQVGDDLARTLFERTLEIAADRELVLELPAQRVSGRVVDPAGDPVEQVRVVIEPEGGTGSPAAALSGADGRFTAQGLIPGRHRAVAGKDGFGSAEARLTVPPDGDVAGVELILTPAALLTLEIAAPTGGTPAKIEAALFSGEGHAVTVGTYTPRADGIFEIRGAAPGTYRLLVGTSNGVAVTQVRVPGRHHVDLALPASVMVRVPALTSLMQGGRVIVFDSEGRPFSSLLAGHLEPSWDLYLGSTRVWALPAGSWRLVVTGPEGRRWEKQVAVTAGENAEVVIE